MKVWLNQGKRKRTADCPLSSPSQAQRCLFAFPLHFNVMASLKSSILSKKLSKLKRSHTTGESRLGELQEETQHRRQEPLPRGYCSPPLLPGPFHSTTLTSLGNTLIWFKLKGSKAHGLLMGLGRSG